MPSGAVPKDGPSAGIALFTALASLFTGKKVDPQLAMTGEITLRGAVLPIGGLKEKLLGAQRAGIRRVLIPRENLADLADVPAEVRDAMPTLEKTTSKPFCSMARISPMSLAMLCIVKYSSQSPAAAVFPSSPQMARPRWEGSRLASSLM